VIKTSWTSSSQGGKRSPYLNTFENDIMIGKYKPCVLLPSLATKYISICGKKDLTFMAYKAFKF